MGVPAFFRWVMDRYPKTLVNIIDETELSIDPAPVDDNEETTINDDIIKIDATKPNPNGEFDNLYLDMNGIIHPCFHPEDVLPPMTYSECFKEIFLYIDRLFGIIRPRKVLYLAIDGVAPRAKMNQQRGRRFCSARDSINQKIEEDRIREELKRQGISVPDEETMEGWSELRDSNVITPGTPFMQKVSIALQYYIHVKMQNDPAWQNIIVFLSDSNVPGEGEHKIMHYVRQQRGRKGYNPNERHVIYGLDADLIHLALATHEPHFYILRELIEPAASKKSTNQLIDKVKKKAHVITGYKFTLLSIAHFRKYLEVDFNHLELPFEFDKERLYDDFILMCFLVGNDFLPNCPNLQIREEAIDLIMQSYKGLLAKMGGWICDGTKLNLERLTMLVKDVSQYEEDIMRKRMFDSEKFVKNKAHQKDNKRQRQDYGNTKDENKKNALYDMKSIALSIQKSKDKLLKIEDEEKTAIKKFKDDNEELNTLNGLEKSAEIKEEVINEDDEIIIDEVVKKDDEIIIDEVVKKDIIIIEDVDNKDVITIDEVDKNDVIVIDEAVKDDEVVKVDDEVVKVNEIIKVDEIIKEDKDIKIDEVIKVNEVIKEDESVKVNEIIKVDEIIKEDKDIKIDEVIKEDKDIKIDESVKVNEVIKEDEVIKVDEIIEIDEVIKVDEIIEIDEVIEIDDDIMEDKSVKEDIIEDKMIIDEKEEVKEMSALEKKIEKEIKDTIKNLAHERMHHANDKMLDMVDEGRSINYFKPGWKRRYYKLKYPDIDDKKLDMLIDDMCEKYVEGLFWIISYYFEGVPSWKWYYPYHYAPFTSDLFKKEHKKIPEFKLNKPFCPFDQLMAVLPPPSRFCLPKKMQKLFVNDNSPLIEYYPSTFKFDMNGKRFLWQAIVLLPFVNENKLTEATKPFYEELTVEEKMRNNRTFPLIFFHKQHKISLFTTEWLDIDKDKTGEELYSLKKEITNDIEKGIYGYICPVNDICPNKLTAPFELGKEVTENETICVTYFDPPYKPNDHVTMEGVDEENYDIYACDIQRRNVPWHERGKHHLQKYYGRNVDEKSSYSHKNEERTSGHYQYKEGGYYKDLDRYSRASDKKYGYSNYKEHYNYYDRINLQQQQQQQHKSASLINSNHPQNFRDKSGNPKFSVNQPAFDRIVKHQQQKTYYNHEEGSGLERFFKKATTSDFNDKDKNYSMNKIETKEETKPIVITSKLRADAPEFVPQCVTQKAIEMTNKYNIDNKLTYAPEYPPLNITNAAKRMSEHINMELISQNVNINNVPMPQVQQQQQQQSIPYYMYPNITNPTYNPYMNQIPQVLLPPSAFFQCNYPNDAGMQQYQNEVQSQHQVQKMATPDDIAKGSVEELLNHLTEETNKHIKKK